MTPSGQPIADLPSILTTLMTHRLRWIVPAIALTVIALGYALIRSNRWEASQALLVRDEAIGNLSRPGRFDDPELMKTAQETILELAKSRKVIAAALLETGPASGASRAKDWPTATEIKNARRRINVVAPNGAELGRTEVFYVKIKHQDKDWAVAFTAALCNQLDARLGELRDLKAQSLVNELTRTVALAKADLDEATQSLAKAEQQVGVDLAELRILNESASGQSNLRQTLIEIKNELRQARTEQRANQQLRQMLIAAQDDPSQLIATPNRLLDSQPALRQLKDGLVANKLQTAQLLGELSPIHPKVQAALASQQEIRSHLYGELKSAMAGLEVELTLAADRVVDLEQQVAQINGRMNQLAEVRARYGNLVTEVDQRSQILSAAQRDLADVRASQAAAHSASLITLLDGPAIGDQPVGPSRRMIVLSGIFGGLMTGWGFVFLTVAIPGPDGRVTGCKQPVVQSSSPAGVDARQPSRGLSFQQALSRISQLSPSWN